MTTGEIATADTLGSAAKRPGVVRSFAGPAGGVLLVLALSALMGLSPAGVPGLWFGYALAVIAVPYTVVALVAGVVVRLRVGSDLSETGPANEGEHAVQQFARFSQRSSLVLAVVLLGALIAAGVLRVLQVAEPLESIWLWGGALIGAAVFTIVVNIPQVYGRRVAALERQAVSNHVGAWRLILVSWIVSPLTWIGYAIVSAVSVIDAGGF